MRVNECVSHVLKSGLIGCCWLEVTPRGALGNKVQVKVSCLASICICFRFEVAKQSAIHIVATVTVFFVLFCFSFLQVRRDVSASSYLCLFACDIPVAWRKHNKCVSVQESPCLLCSFLRSPFQRRSLLSVIGPTEAMREIYGGDAFILSHNHPSSSTWTEARKSRVPYFILTHLIPSTFLARTCDLSSPLLMWQRCRLPRLDKRAAIKQFTLNMKSQTARSSVSSLWTSPLEDRGWDVFLGGFYFGFYSW